MSRTEISPNRGSRNFLSSAMLRLTGWRAVILCVLGLGFLVVAAFLLHIVAGFAATGVALLVLEWRLQE